MSDPRALRLRLTLRRAIRTWWDTLGLSCAVSLTWLVVVSLPFAVFQQLTRGGRTDHGPAAAVAVTMLVALYGLVCAAVHRVAHRAVHRDEPVYAAMWHGSRGIWVKAVALATVQIAVLAGCCLNAFFYIGVRSLPTTAIGVLFLYVASFWLLNCQFHWPLLVASEAGLITRADGRRAGLWSVFRNAFVLAVGAPGYALALLVVLTVQNGLLAASGVGLALVAPALTAILGCQAVRDHMVRLGSLPPPADEGPTPPDVWRVPK